MRYPAIFLIFIAHIFTLQAQQPGRPPAAAAPRATGRITGTVLDASTQKPVSYASVGLLDPATGKPVNGGVCGDDGQFVLAGVPAGTYAVEVTYLGYQPLRRPDVAVSAGGTAALGNLTLAPAAKALGEVTVVAQKPLIEEKVDRTVYNAEQDQTTRGGDATDVLKRVPLLSVDLDGNVSLRGSSNIKVLINNKPSTIAANSIADALKQIPADQIKTVEVITSPSAKYDAEGSGGIINIITKGNALQGATLGVDASVGLRSSNLSVNGSYRKGKLGLSLGGFGRAGYNIPGEYTNSQVTRSLVDNTLSTTLQSADTRNHQLFGRYTLGLDYDFNKQNSLTGSVAYGTRLARTYQDGLRTLTYDGIPNFLLDPVPRTVSQRDVYVNDFSGTVDASLNYTHTFAKPQHELSVLTLVSRNNRDNSFTNNIFDPSSEVLTSRLRNDNPSDNTEYTAQLDYQNPLSKNQILEMGVKDILRRVNSDYATLLAGPTGDFQTLPGGSQSNAFKYKQNVSAGYVAFTQALPHNITFKPGVRYEYATIAANFANGAAVDIPDYGVLVPSANLSRRFKSGNTLKLAYNRRIQRPSLQFLNPNRQASNPLSVTIGNPQLAPEYTNNYELAYSTAVKRVNLNFSTFARNTTGAIQAVRTVLGADTIRTTYANIGREDAYGGSVFASANSPKFNLSGGVDAYYAVLNNNVPDPNFTAHNEGLVVAGRVFGSYNFTPVWGVQLFSFYRGRQVQLQGDQSGFGVYSLSVKRDFAEKRGSIGFGAENFFTTNGITIRNNLTSPLLVQKSSNVLHNLSFKVNISYRIGKLTVDPRSGNKKSIDNDDLKQGDSGDLGGGGGGGGGGNAGGGRPGGAPGGGRPAGAPAGAAPRGVAPGSVPRNVAPADSAAGQPAGVPVAPGTSAPVVPTEPAAPTQPAAPLGSPSPGTTTPKGITPAGSPGGRP